MQGRFLVVDDHPLMREAIRLTLQSVAGESRIDVAATLAEALRLADDTEPIELAVLDLGLPDASGFESLKRLRQHRPECRIVVMSGDTDGSTILHCIELGATGFIPKSMSSDGVMNALRLVMSGNIYVPHQALAQPRTAVPGGSHRGLRVSDPRQLGLTDRQVDVLKLILKGLPNKLICRRLDLAEGTVKVHVSAVLRALGARNRTQAVIAANELGLRVES